MRLKMIIPVKSLSDAVDALAGKRNPNFDPKRMIEMKKSIAVDMTDVEKRVDPQIRNIIFNNVLICRQIAFLIDEIIANRNLQFFAKKELERRVRELDEYMKSKPQGDGLLEKLKGNLSALNKDDPRRAQIEKILALEKLIEELEAQNKILIKQRDKYIHTIAKKLSAELKVGVLERLPESKRTAVVEKVFRAVVDFDVPKEGHAEKGHAKGKRREIIEKGLTLELSTLNVIPAREDLIKTVNSIYQVYEREERAIRMFTIEISKTNKKLEETRNKLSDFSEELERLGIKFKKEDAGLTKSYKRP